MLPGPPCLLQDNKTINRQRGIDMSNLRILPEVEYRALRAPARCCLCEWEMHIGEKAVILRAPPKDTRRPTFVMHKECIEEAKEVVNTPEIDDNDAA